MESFMCCVVTKTLSTSESISRIPFFCLCRSDKQVECSTHRMWPFPITTQRRLCHPSSQPAQSPISYLQLPRPHRATTLRSSTEGKGHNTVWAHGYGWDGMDCSRIRWTSRMVQEDAVGYDLWHIVIQDRIHRTRFLIGFKQDMIGYDRICLGYIYDNGLTVCRLRRS